MIFSLAEKGPFRLATKPAPSSVSLSSFSSKLVSLSSLNSSKEVTLRPARPRKFFSKERSEEYKYLWTKISGKIGTKRDRSRPENRTVLTCPPRPRARTTSTTVAPPMGEDDQHHGHPAHGQRRPAPRSPRPWARTTGTTVAPPMGKEDQHHGRLVHGRGRPAPRSPRPLLGVENGYDEVNVQISAKYRPVTDRSEYDDRNTNEPGSVITLLPHMHAVRSLCSDRASVPLGRYVATELFRNVDTTISPCILVDPSMLSPEDRSEPISCFSPF
ncbi:hypothetical protein F2Q68_00030181 [Brassica cretica]|uniref:Uncharacterized protein n=1 Tax=Brassica cretica TaxID=69181 RepID=A0A8S9GB88_BRACR|nr:hypothetical protein F2Q68_00030181 [Brassica cretica]